MDAPQTPPQGGRRKRRRLALWSLAGVAGLFLVIQLVPYGRDHTDPPVTSAARFSPPVQQIVTDSCADCHSNETTWPWYTNVAPASWLVQSDVDEGRATMNLSEWNRRPQPELDEVVEAITDGEMPPLKYRVMPNHANARLSDRQKQELIAGFRRLYGAQPPQMAQGSG